MADDMVSRAAGLGATAAASAIGAAGAAGASAGAGLGVAAGVSATTAAPAAGLGPVGWAIIAVAIIGSFLLRGKKKSPPPEAQGIRLGQPVDGNAPQMTILGQPWFTPPLAIQYAVPGSVWPTGHGKASIKGNRTVRFLHAGVGQNACSGLELRVGGTDIWTNVTLDDEPERIELTMIGTDRRRWGFPAKDIEPSKVSIYFNTSGTRVLRYVGDAEAGHDPESVASESVAATTAEPRLFQKSSGLFSGTALPDSDMSAFDVRLGCLLPKSGIVDESSMKAEVLFKNATSGKLTGSSTNFVSKKSILLGTKDFGLAHTDDARQYLWARLEVANRTVSQIFTQGIVKEFRVSYTVKPSVFVDIRKTPGVTGTGTGSGGWEAVFAEPVPATVTKVEATYKTADKVTTEDGFRFDLTDGSVDQDAIGEQSGGAFFGKATSTRSTFPVGLKLDQYTKRRYSTTQTVDDILVGVEAGSRGFTSIDMDGNQQGARRIISIRLKETAASDAPATTKNDPSTGWVQFLDPETGKSEFKLVDRFTGPGTWFFPCGDLLSFLKTGKATTGNALPLRAYDVEVTALDAAGTDNFGTLLEDRWFSDLWFQHATEIRRVGFVLPRQSMITLETGADFDSAALVECRMAGRICIIPSSGATVGDDGLPTPRTVAYSRNPVWLACNWLVDPIGGAGRYFTWSHVIAYLSEARTAADYCDTTITLRDGTTLVRSMCDLAIGEDGQRDSCGNWLAKILAGSGVFAYFRTGWHWVTDTDTACATDPVVGGDFTIVEEQDCLPGACEIDVSGVEEIPTELQVEFRDGDNHGARTTEPIVLDDPQPEPRQVERVEFPGVTRRNQLIWAGTQLLKQMRGNGTVPLRTFLVVGTLGRGLRLMQPDPGDLVKFTSARLGVTALKCRVHQSGYASGLRPALVLVEHVASAYSAGFQGANSSVPPGTRQASDDAPKVSKLTLSKVTGTATVTVGGAP